MPFNDVQEFAHYAGTFEGTTLLRLLFRYQF